MSKHITLRRGLDLSLKGAVERFDTVEKVAVGKVALVPDDFHGFTPKVAAKPGEKVVVGQPLLIDKNNPDIALVSPVCGTVDEVVRGERRKILRITVAVDGEANEQMESKSADLRTTLMRGGVWAMMRQLPYDIVPDAGKTPRDIFITTFDSAPLAVPVIADAPAIADGIQALLSLTEGTIYIGVREGDHSYDALESDRVAVISFDGPHPSGLASVQAAAIAPVNKGETIWMLSADTLARIGQVTTKGVADWSTTVAVTGSEVTAPALVTTTVGAQVTPIIAGRLTDDNHHRRIISGNVLTGCAIDADGYLRFPYRQLTIIPEGDDVDEFMGWASLSPNKMSQNRSFLSRIFGRKQFSPDARINGGRRAMIMSGEYEKVMPMDIMPEHLIKAILARDIDRMEALGIYEVTPADFALCEYVDPSKLELQKIVREGLDFLRKELS